MILALENLTTDDPPETVRTYVAGHPTEPETSNGWLISENDKHNRRQVMHDAVSWENVEFDDLGKGPYEFQGFHYRTFATYAEAAIFARLGPQLDTYRGTAVFYIPSATAGTFYRLTVADAVAMHTVDTPIGVTVKVHWTVRGAWPVNAGSEVLVGGLTDESGGVLTAEDGTPLTPE